MVITVKIQKVFRAGNSKTVVAIPQEISQKVGLKTGQPVMVDCADGTVLIRKVKKDGQAKKSGVSREFYQWLNKVLKEDKGILDDLAVR